MAHQDDPKHQDEKPDWHSKVWRYVGIAIGLAVLIYILIQMPPEVVRVLGQLLRLLSAFN